SRASSSSCAKACRTASSAVSLTRAYAGTGRMAEARTHIQLGLARLLSVQSAKVPSARRLPLWILAARTGNPAQLRVAQPRLRAPPLYLDEPARATQDEHDGSLGDVAARRVERPCQQRFTRLIPQRRLLHDDDGFLA